MQLNIKQRLSVSMSSEETLPYYYRIDSKSNYLFGCVTLERHYIIRMISESDIIQYEIQAKTIESNSVDIEYSGVYQTFRVSNEGEFATALSELSVALKSTSNALNIKR